MATTTPRLPKEGNQTPENHVAMSRRFLDHAERELKRGRRLQASEKVWGAVAHQLNAIAVQRGWSHGVHNDFYDMIAYLQKEYGKDDLLASFKAAEGDHSNFYQNRESPETIQEAIDRNRKFVETLEDLRKRPMEDVYIGTRSDQSLVKRLTGRSPAVGTSGKYINEENRRRYMGEAPAGKATEAMRAAMGKAGATARTAKARPKRRRTEPAKGNGGNGGAVNVDVEYR